MRTLLIDGTNLFIRSYTVDTTTDVDGNPVGGVSGTLKSLRSIVRNLKPGRVIFVWDGPGGSINRRKIFNQYKEGRRPRTVVGRNYEFESVEAAAENKLWQIKHLQLLISCLPVCQIITQNIEADDAIAYIVNGADFFGHNSSIIATCDKDFYQLIGEKTVIYNPIKKTLVTTSTLLEDTGYHPNNWLFFKSINGDKSDNIDGVRGFGPKTIAKLFSVDKETELTPTIIENATDFMPTDLSKAMMKRYEVLTESIDLIERNWKLMSLKDPLISVSAKEKLTQRILNFSPTLNKPKFYVDLMKLGGLGIPTSFFDEFQTLRRRV